MNKIVKGKMILVDNFELEFPESWNYNEIENWLITNIEKTRNDEEEVVIKFEDIIIEEKKEEKDDELV